MMRGDEKSKFPSGLPQLLMTALCLLVLAGVADAHLRVSSTLREFCGAPHRDRVRISRVLGRHVRLPWDHVYGVLNEFCKNPRVQSESLLDLSRRLAVSR